MRTVVPALRTLPSSTLATFNAWPISATVTARPRNENEEVRAVTLSSGICASKSISSSDRPSEKYSWSFFSLISVNGSTAIDLSETAGSVVRATGGGAAGASGRFGLDRLFKTMYARAARRSAVTMKSTYAGRRGGERLLDRASEPDEDDSRRVG